MSFFATLKDSWFFCRANVRPLALLCLPLILLEALYDAMIPGWLGPSAVLASNSVGAVFFYSLYMPALILLLDSHHQKASARLREILQKAGSLFPTFMQMTLLAASLACLAAIPLLITFVLTGLRGSLGWIVGGATAVLFLWAAGRLAFAPFLLVLRNRGPFDALLHSFAATRHCVWLCLVFILGPGMLVFSLTLTLGLFEIYPSTPFREWLTRAGLSCLQLTSPILVYHLYARAIEKTSEHVAIND